MGIPIKKFVDIGLIAAGAAGVNIPTGNKEALKLEAEENELLAELVRQVSLTNTILLRVVAEGMEEDEFKEFVEDLG